LKKHIALEITFDFNKARNGLDQFSLEIALSTHEGIQNIMIDLDVYLPYRNGDN